MKAIAVISARMTSSRLPGKVIKDLNGKSVLYHLVERLEQCPGLNCGIHLGTSKNKNNIPLIEEAKKCGISFYAGAEEDLLERFIAIAKRESADIVLRVGGDQPLLGIEIANNLLSAYAGEDWLYVDTPVSRGVATELFSVAALEKIREKYRGPALAKYIIEYPHLFVTRGIDVDDEFSRPEFRLTLDTVEDYQLIEILYKQFYTDKKPVDLREILKYLDDQPEIANMNRFVEDKQINWYVKELAKQPVFKIFQTNQGKYVAKNRMDEIVPFNEFNAIMNKSDWENFS